MVFTANTLRSKLLHITRKNKPSLKLAGVMLVIMLFAVFGFFGVANAQNSVLIQRDTLNEGALDVNAGAALSDSDALSSQTSESKSANEKQLCVYICGQVQVPGVYYVASGARVCDVVECAQGFLENASLESVNLAREVSDGEQIIIYEQNQTAAGQSDAAALSSSSSVGTSSQYININTANASQLEQIPGIGAAFAQRIIDYRTTTGAFKTIEELTNVSGIGDKKLESMRDYICV